MDVRREPEVRALFQQTISTFGGIDYLLNNAGVEGVLGPITECPEAACNEVLNTNIKGVFLCMKHAIPAMLEQGGGAIVNTGGWIRRAGYSGLCGVSLDHRHADD